MKNDIQMEIIMFDSSIIGMSVDGFAEVENCLHKQSFEISYDEEKSCDRFTAQKVGEISTHCVNTLFQIAHLFHGFELGSKMYRIFLGSYSKIEIFGGRVEDRLTTRIIIVNLFSDCSATKIITSCENSGDNLFIEMDEQHKHEVQSRVIELGEMIRGNTLKAIVNYALGPHESASSFDPVESTIFECIKEIQLESLCNLKAAIRRNERTLGDQTGFMYYFLLRFHTKPNINEYKCHAFVLQQLNDITQHARPSYHLWQSCLHQFSLFDSMGRTNLDSAHLDIFFEDLSTILKSREWDLKINHIWKTWFYASPFKNSKIPFTINKINHWSEKDVTILQPSAISLICCAAKFNPQKIAVNIRYNFTNMMIKAASCDTKKLDASSSDRKRQSVLNRLSIVKLFPLSAIAGLCICAGIGLVLLNNRR
jgi:hypothetical protein